MAFHYVPDLLDKIAGRSLKKRGFPNTDLIMEWPKIMGETLAKVSHPRSLIFAPNSRRDGTLLIACGGAFSMQIEMMTPVLLERVNLYFGYTAITRIRIVQTVF